ncbi:hypothetical protein CTATCC11996_09887 [Comamonas testosteroni ATCC 11996]|nr:hypothetical protein CTATCC11996_09887 [Comamonas testosteroni ATCC 11996]
MGQAVMDQFRDFGSPVGIGLDNSRFARSAAQDDRDIGSHRPAANDNSM